MQKRTQSKRELKLTRAYQIAALPYRKGAGGIEICLVTTRQTARWTLPKGWPMKGRKDFAAARIEAEEEAGISGAISRKPIGHFKYFKRLTDNFELIDVTVYPLFVTRYLEQWKEQLDRKVRWFPLKEAAALVDEPELKSLLSKIGLSSKLPTK